MKQGRGLALAGVVFVAVLLVAGPAGAHTALVESAPADGDTVARAPANLLLTFSAPVDLPLTTVKIIDPGRGAVGLGEVSLVSPRSMKVALPTLRTGSFLVEWQALSPDGHAATGSVVFHVGTARGQVVSSAGPSLGGRLVDTGSGVSRFAWHAGLCLVIGALLWPQLRRHLGPIDAPASRVAAFEGHALSAGITIIALASLARFGFHVARVSLVTGLGPARALLEVIGTTQGRVWVVVVVASGALLASARFAGPRSVVASATILVVGHAFTGHAASSPHPSLAAVVTAAHLAAFGAWIGPLALMVFLMRRRSWRVNESSERRPALRRVMTAFSPLAVTMVITLAVTGVVGAWLNLANWGNLSGTLYGRFILAKVALLLIALPFGLFHWLWSSRGMGHGLPSLLRSASGELAVLVAVIAFGAVLTGMAPGRSVPPASARPTTAAGCAAAPIRTLGCYQRVFTTAVNEQGADGALRHLDEVRVGDPYVEGQCHQIVHTIGTVSFQRYGDVATALSFGSSLCWSGYYHGVIESSISEFDDAQLMAKMPSVCASGTWRKYSFDHYNCLHGLGHGVTIRLGQDSLAALPFCDALPDAWEQQSCTSGAFMQEIVVDQMEGQSTTPLPDDLLYPCTTVDERYKQSCYLIVTSRVLDRVGGDFAAAFAACRGADRGFVTTCYQSMGRDASGRSLVDPQKVKALCDMADPEGRAPCIVGASQNAVYNDRDGTRATALCDAVDEKLRQPCITARDSALALL